MLAVELTDLDCSTCTASQKIARGCTAKARAPEIIGGEEFHRCPRSPLLEDPEYFSEVFWGHQQFKKGMLPEEGALLSQPAKLMELYFTIDRTRNWCEREKEKRQKADAARAAKKKHRQRAVPG